MALSGRSRDYKSATGPDSRHHIRRLRPYGASGLAMTTCQRAQPTPHLINTVPSTLAVQARTHGGAQVVRTRVLCDRSGLESTSQPLSTRSTEHVVMTYVSTA